jgi:cell division protein FtsB
MSQRLISDLSIERATDLSRFLSPIGFRSDGRPIFPVAGASPDDPSNDPGGDDGGSGDGGGSGSEGGDGAGTGDGSEGDGGKPEDDEKVSKSELERTRIRMQAADRRAAAAEQKLKEIEDKDKTELEKATGQVETLTSENSELKKENTLLKAKVSFLGSNEHSWHDPDVALNLIDLSEVMNEDGTVDKKALKSEMDKLAKDKPYLVKSAGSGKPEGDGKGPSGHNPGGKGSDKKGLDDAALKRKYPALR